MDFRDFCIVAERKTRGKTKMGVSAFRKASERYNSRVQGGFRVKYNRQKTSHVRAVQSRPKRKNATDRLSSTS